MICLMRLQVLQLMILREVYQPTVATPCFVDSLISAYDVGFEVTIETLGTGVVTIELPLFIVVVEVVDIAGLLDVLVTEFTSFIFPHFEQFESAIIFMLY